MANVVEIYLETEEDAEVQDKPRRRIIRRNIVVAGGRVLAFAAGAAAVSFAFAQLGRKNQSEEN